MNNTALITGSYGGLGRCFAEIHASRGGSLVLVGRSPEKLENRPKKFALVILSRSEPLPLTFPDWRRLEKYMISAAGTTGA